jgi:predicted enzyme related to lactoylglutathione lyase
MEGIPPHISSYLRVEDVDAALAAAVEAGGKALTEPTDIPPGRFAGVASPTGAAFLLFHEADPSAEDKPSGPGAIHWVELRSTDLKADLSWLEKSFAIGFEEMPMPDGPYFILKSGDEQVGGAMSAMMPGVPSNWLVWLNTPGVDDCAARVKSNGGQILAGPTAVEGIGKMYVAMDPAGIAFGIIEPAAA